MADESFRLYDSFAVTKCRGYGNVAIPPSALEDDEFIDLIAWDVQLDDLCGKIVNDPETGNSVLCVLLEGHVRGHFGLPDLGIGRCLGDTPPS